MAPGSCSWRRSRPTTRTHRRLGASLPWTPRRGSPTTTQPSSFTPSRNWAWPPTEGADYYFVEFFRAGQVFYTARPTEPRLTLPDRITFAPGVYRWRVRPGRGDPTENRLDAPIVDSEFVIQR